MLFTLAFVLGVCTPFSLAKVPAGGVCLALTVLVLPLMCVPRLRWFGAFALGFAWAAFQAGKVAADALPDSVTLRHIEVRGTILGLPEARADGSIRFRFQIEHWHTDAARTWRVADKTVLLTWYRDAPDLSAKQRWQLAVKLKPRRGLANPGGFDYARWLFSERLAGTGYVAGGGRRLGHAGSCSGPDCWRQRIALGIARRLGDNHGGLVRALAVGDRSGVTEHDWKVLRATGTAHLMAISGLHIGFVAGLAYLGVRRLRARMPLRTPLPVAVIAAVAGMSAAVAYAVLAGMTLPTQRALIMVAVAFGGRILARRNQVVTALQLAVWLVLLYDPLAVLSTGFWLSFGAVGCILIASGARFGRVGRFRQAATVQLSLSVGLLPVLGFSGLPVPLLSPLANAFAVPLVGLLVVPLVLLSLVLAPLTAGASGVVLYAAEFILDGLMSALAVLAELPATQLTLAFVEPWLMLPIAAGALMSLAPGRAAVRGCGVALLTAALLHPSPAPADGDAWLTLLDVGQGLSAVLRTRSHTLVYDTGPRFPSGLDMGQSVLIPFLVRQGIRRVDRLVISHDDIDHLGGARALFQALDVQRVLSGTPEAITWARSTRCRAGQRWRWDSVVFEVLAPFRVASGNNASCVLKVTTARGRTLLLTGDIEAVVEHGLGAEAGERLRAQTLVAPHHGSRTSSTPAFIEQVTPRLTLFPAGYANRFGFPKTDIVARYRERGSRVLVTGDAGAITLQMNSGSVESFRARSPRLWRARPAE